MIYGIIIWQTEGYEDIYFKGHFGGPAEPGPHWPEAST